MTRASDRGSRERECETCRKMFIPDQPHHRTCRDCFSNRRGGQASHGRDSAFRPTTAELPESYLAQGYFADPGRGVVFPELLTTVAQEVASALAAADISMSQVRRYFTMARGLEEYLKSNKKSYDEVANELRRMRANVFAVVGREQEFRKRERLERTLKSFIEANVDIAVQDEQSFKKGFLPHFECVLAYFYWYNSQKGGSRRGA